MTGALIAFTVVFVVVILLIDYGFSWLFKLSSVMETPGTSGIMRSGFQHEKGFLPEEVREESSSR